MPKPIRHLRWTIGGLLFLSTVINYIDRQTLSVLAPFLKQEYRWSNSDFALLIIAFRAAYAVGQTLAGRVLDRLGTRRGLSLAVAWYSLAAMATSLATGLASFCGFRFLLGLGEAGNWPGATKAVAEWFPARERGWAVALFDSGSAIGAAVAPALVLGVYHFTGSWRPVFLVTGVLGFGWLLLFRRVYRRPEEHPRLSADELALITRDRVVTDGSSGPRPSLWQLLRLPQTWGIVLGKALTDPVWFFITDWFAIYVASRGFQLEEGLLAFWVPFLAADIGNFAGGGVSSWLIQRGWPVTRARKAVVIVSAIGMTALSATVLLQTLPALVACFAVATFSYAALSTMILILPADVFPSESVATVSGLGGTGAGVGTIAATYLIGRVADSSSFAPVMVTASLVPLVAMSLILALVRERAVR